MSNRAKLLPAAFCRRGRGSAKIFTVDLLSGKAQGSSAGARDCYKARAHPVLWSILRLLPPPKARTAKQLGKLIFCESLRHFGIDTSHRKELEEKTLHRRNRKTKILIN